MVQGWLSTLQREGLPSKADECAASKAEGVSQVAPRCAIPWPLGRAEVFEGRQGFMRTGRDSCKTQQKQV